MENSNRQGSSGSSISSMHRLQDDIIEEDETDEETGPAYIKLEMAADVEDFPKRIEFCKWLLDRHSENPQFIKDILFCGEVCFTFEGIQSFSGSFYWLEPQYAQHNSFSQYGDRAIIKSPMLTHYNTNNSVNLWVGILDNTLIGPFELPPSLDSTKYLNFLKQDLPELLDDLPLDTRQKMWILHESKGDHFGSKVRAYMRKEFGERWIGNKNMVAWPPCSTDIHPLYYFFWVHLGIKVYTSSKRFSNVDELREKITNSCDIVRNEVSVFSNVSKNWIRRLGLCLEMNGGEFNFLL